jgi:phosphoribosylamine--glycine ligase
MNILILGAGGREHTFAWKISQSPLCKQLFVAPGNSGTSSLATNLNVSVVDFEGIKEQVLTHSITMVVVGPEDPLVNGIYYKTSSYNMWRLLDLKKQQLS